MTGAPSARGVRPFQVYLSGSIRKGDTDVRPSETFWGEREEQCIRNHLTGMNARLVNPATANIRRSDYYANYGCDLYLVSTSDVVVADARTEKGVGVGAELMFAVISRVPVITVAPPETNYRRAFVANVCGEDLRDWVHPFVFGMSSVIVDSFEAAGELVASVARGRHLEAASPPGKAIEYFLSGRQASA